MALTEETRALEAPGARPAAGQDLVLGRYRLGRRLGAGGFGAVHEAFDTLLERRVAVKVIPADGAASQRDRREARAAARLDHPGIVALFDAGEEPGSRFLVSELVEGRTLAQLAVEGELTDRDVLRIGLALCDALAHAHERGVVHRDVKPQNVLVPDRPRTWRGAAKLTDFGVATLAGDDPLTMTGDVVGTLAYMAPEQAAGRRVDDRADLYALGVVLYEALAGVHPVRASSPAATARRVGSVLTPLQRHRGDLPPALCAAIDRAVRPEPGQRAGLEDLADALEDALVEIADEGGTIVRHPLERRFRPPRGLPRVAAATGAAGLAAAAVGLVPPVPPAPPAAVAAAVALTVLALPRAGWALSALSVTGLLTAAVPSHAGVALLLALAAAPVPLLLPRRPLAWSAPAAAPLLGLAGLAGAFPALAGTLPRWRERAALGGLGAWWLLLAEPLAGRALHLGAPEAAAGREDFEGALYLTMGEVVAPVVASGTPALIVLWAAAAALLPVVVRGWSLAARSVTAAVWAGALAAGTTALAEALATAPPHGLIAGAVAAGAVAAVADPGYWRHAEPEASADGGDD